MKEFGYSILKRIGPPKDKYGMNECYTVCCDYGISAYDLCIWAALEAPEWICYADKWDKLVSMYLNGERLYDTLCKIKEQGAVYEASLADSLCIV